MKYLIEPWAHQKEGERRAVLRSMEGKGFGFLFEPGTGKSGTIINTLRRLFNGSQRVMRTLIFCPRIVVPNWKTEWGKHSTLDVGRNLTLLQGAGAKRVGAFQKGAYADGGDAGPKPRGHIFVTNYEALLMPKLYEAFVQWQPEVLVFDESHYLKSPTAKRSKLAEALANPYDKSRKPWKKLPKPLTYLLTGTPVLNSPMDIFQQWLILDGGESFGGNFFAFRARYFRDRNAGMPKARYFPKWEIMTAEQDGYDALREINERLGESSMYVKKDDCLDLPPEIEQVVPVPMSPEQARLYKEMKEDLIAFVNDKACVAMLAITKAQRLMQIASGYAKLADGDVHTIEKTPKMEYLQELLENLLPSGKVIIWAVYHENYKQIAKVCEDLGVKYVQVHGGITGKQQEQAVLDFNEGDAQVFIGHPKAGGIGISLVIAPHTIFYSRDFNLADYLQAKARNRRGGSEIHKSINYYHLVCEGTIEELVQKRLASKIDMSDKILSDLTNELAAQW